MAITPICQVVYLGAVEFLEAWDHQKLLVQQVHDGQRPNTLLLLEHPPVYTMGRRGTRDQVLLDDGRLADLGISLHEVDRGGEVTFHGPGQLVGYAILNLREWGGPLKYVRTLEQVMIRTLADFGIHGQTLEGLTGMWVGEEKIGAIGVKISRGISYHGFSLNVNTDLTWFEHIIPCGICDQGITSMSKVLGRSLEVEPVAYSLAYHFGEAMGFRMREDGAALDQLATLSRAT